MLAYDTGEEGLEVVEQDDGALAIVYYECQAPCFFQ